MVITVLGRRAVFDFLILCFFFFNLYLPSKMGKELESVGIIKPFSYASG